MTTGPGIPFYPQSFDFTCGPACLIMAMRAFDPSLEATRELEIDIWREANLVEAYASSRQGLAMAAHRCGFDVRTQGNVETIELLDCLDLEMAPEQRAVAEALHEDLKARCQAAGIKDTARQATVGDLRAWLAEGGVPLILIDARLVEDEALPHWVVVTKVADQAVDLHDPLAKNGDTRVDARAFERWLGYRGTSCAVVVEGFRTLG